MTKDKGSVWTRELGSCGSTNKIAKEMGESGAPHGSWVVAESQSAGRGRLGRVWSSEPGNLYLSLILRQIDPQAWSWIPLLSGIVVCESLNREFKGLDAQVKWPNDLWVSQKKLAGFLCEGVKGAGHSFVVVGVGVNVKHAPVDVSTCIEEILPDEKVSVEFVRDLVRDSILNEVSQLSVSLSDRWITLKKRYEKIALTCRGAWIEWMNDEKTSNTGQVQGLGDQGELLVRIESGVTVSLLASDVKIMPRTF